MSRWHMSPTGKAYYATCELCGRVTSKLSLRFVKEAQGRLCFSCEKKFVRAGPRVKQKIKDDIAKQRIEGIPRRRAWEAETGTKIID